MVATMDRLGFLLEDDEAKRAKAGGARGTSERRPVHTA